jgi:hypothetical protein
MPFSWLYCFFAWLLFLLGPVGAFAQTPPVAVQGSDEPTAKSPDGHRWFLSGSASEQYRFRYANDLQLLEFDNSGNLVEHAASKSESDHDLRLFLSGQLSESTDRFCGDFSVALWHDLNGVPAAGVPSSFASVNGRDGSKLGRDRYDVYSLYAEYHSTDLWALVRGGRQTSEYGRPTTFDGATAKLNVIKTYLDLAFFGGRTVHFFETSHGLFESWLASAAVVIRPVAPLRIETDYRYSVEDATVREAIRDNSYNLAIWYQAADDVQVKAYARGINDAISNSGASAKVEWARWLLGVNADIDSQLVTLHQLNESDNSYFEVLGESLPYLRLNVDIWKKIETGFGVYGAELGWQQRIVIDHRPTQFNRSFGRTYLQLEADDIGFQGTFLNCVIEYNYTFWNPGFADNTLIAIGGSVGYDKKPIKATIGSYYYRYKYDYYIDIREYADVRSYFGEIRYDPYKWLSGRLSYTFEQFDRNIHVVTLTVVETF